MLAGITSCNKYLDKKPEKALVLITSLDDIQRLLDKNDIMNQNANSGLLELIADDYYTADADLAGGEPDERTNYVWDPAAVYDIAWTNTYQRSIYYANVVLDQMPRIRLKSGEEQRFDQLKGAALFFRSWAFYHLAQLYCAPYSQANLEKPGIVLRLNAAILDKSVRATVKQTYDQIRNDLEEAASLLPEEELFPTRPTKAAAYGALARISLAMRNYEDAAKYADACLSRNNELIDYNAIDPNAFVPFQRFNKETVFYSTLSLETIITMDYAKIDTLLYQSYETDDLRKDILFATNWDGSTQFNGSYDGGAWVVPFNGIAVDEMYLIRAETAARAGNLALAMQSLNHLLKFRWNKNTFTERTASGAAEALAMIITERRKELIFRGIRWSDLRRYNEEGAGITLKRFSNGNNYSLPPGDPRWVLLIPPKVISLNGIQQNPR